MTWPWRITWLYLGFMLLLPIAALVAKALSLPPGEIWRIATDPVALSAYQVTLTTALAAAATNGVAGLAIAWVLVRYRFPGRAWLDAALDLPLALPAAVTGLTLVTVYGDRGWLGSLLLPLGIKVAYSRLGVYLAMLFSSLPFVVRSVQPILQDLDPGLEEAAAGLGATPGRRFREILLPLLLPAILTGVALGFARAVGEYGAVVLVASNLPFKDLIAAVLMMQRLEQYDIAGATVLGLVMLLFALGLLGLINLLQARPQRGARGLAQRPGSLASSTAFTNRRTGLVLLGPVLLYLGLVLIVPIANLLFQATQAGWGPFLTLWHQREFWAALRLTVIIVAIAVPLNTAFGLCAAWAIVKASQGPHLTWPEQGKARPLSQFWERGGTAEGLDAAFDSPSPEIGGKGLGDGGQPVHSRQQYPQDASSSFLLSLIDLPLSISPVVAGIMIVLLYGRGGWFSPLLEAGQIRIVFALPGIVLATAFVTLPFVVRQLLPRWAAINPNQAEAARSLGLGNWAIFQRLELPQIRGGLMYGVVLTVARAMGEFGAVTVVSGSIIGKTQTLSLYIEDAYKNYETSVAYAAAIVLVGLTLGMVGLRLWLEGNKA